ncbi:DUF424 family protein [Candidatus Woesearchaeota archaeon]|nr:DUF424 family protein [Candidatus Woesearchaeota archaeon]
MILKLHKKDERIVAAVCDSNLLGKKIEEGKAQLDLASDFYNGEEKDDLTVGDTIRNADSVNLVGENAVKLGIEEGIIDPGHVKKIGGVPYAQAVVVHE